MRVLWAAAMTVLMGAGAPVQAHVASNGFLSARVEGADVTGSIELAVRDLEMAVGVDADRDGKVTWGELRAAGPAVADYLRAHLELRADGEPCAWNPGALEVDDRVDGTYAVLPLRAHCAASIHRLGIHYSVLEGIDPSHRGLLRLDAAGSTETGVLGAPDAHAEFVLASPSRWRTVAEYGRAGVGHILSGIDHLLFLVSLLLPAVLLRQDGRWLPVAEWRPALGSVVKVVTAFTLAHSLTLTLAALNVVRLPSRLTESVIAASIVVAALNNLVPVVTQSRARIAFGFGLLHGFGFASVLADMGLPPGARLLSLFAFNAGIEAGQLAVVLAVMPLLYGLRTGGFYRRAVMPWGSGAIALLALVWLVQRATG